MSQHPYWDLLLILSILGHANPRLFLDLVFEYIHNKVKITLGKTLVLMN